MSTIRPLVKGFSKTVGFWPLFFVVALVVVGHAAISSAEGNDLLVRAQRTEAAMAAGPYQAATGFGAVSGSPEPFAVAGTSSDPESADSATLDASSVVGSNQALVDQPPRRVGIVRYKVKRGDTLSGIAAAYGITLATLQGANPSAADPLKRGKTLVVLPVSGMLYTTTATDTLASVAGRFNVDPAALKEYNPGYVTLFGVAGRTVVVPAN